MQMRLNNVANYCQFSPSNSTSLTRSFKSDEVNRGIQYFLFAVDQRITLNSNEEKNVFCISQ